MEDMKMDKEGMDLGMKLDKDMGLGHIAYGPSSRHPRGH